MGLLQLRILVQDPHQPVTHAIDLLQQLEEAWTAWGAELAAQMTRDLGRLPNPRELADHGARVIAERIKWTLQSVVSADPAAKSINDLITGAADRAAAAICRELVDLQRKWGSDAPLGLADELAGIITRHGPRAQPPAAG